MELTVVAVRDLNAYRFLHELKYHFLLVAVPEKYYHFVHVGAIPRRIACLFG